MKEEDELEILLGEISHATSSLNHHHHHHHHHHHQNQNSHVDHGNLHASCVPQRINGRGWCECDGNNMIHHIMYDDECLKQHKYASASSPVSGFSLQSDGSSSSLFSGGGGPSLSDFGSPSSPPFSFDYKNGSDSNFTDYFDYFDLSRDFSKMHITSEQKGIPISPYTIRYHDQSLEGTMGVRSFEKYGAHDNYKKGFSDFNGLNVSLPRKSMTLEDVRFLPSQSDKLFYRSEFENSAMSPRFYRDDVVVNNNFPMGFMVPDVPLSSLGNPSVGDSLFYPSRKGMIPIEAMNSFYAPNTVQLSHLSPQYNDENLIHYQPPERNKAPLCVQIPPGNVEAFMGEDSFIIHGEGIDHGMTRDTRFRGHNAKSRVGKTKINRSQMNENPLIYCPQILQSKCSSLAAAQGNIYHLAKDQNGCRFLQRIFEEGTSLDVHLIFVEIIDHTVELMMNPFGNYLMQKLLEVCSEEQRMHVLLRATKEPTELVRVSLNTHGTRVVQKLIETVKTKQQISVIIAALEPGFLALVKDLNGNHVIKRCLQCFPHDDRKFIFAAAAKYCVEMATHQYGCCVLQRCISHSTSEHLHNLVAEISANALLLAQDAYGNYVIQFILDLKIPNAISKITSQFEGNYIHLSTQKFSSHVVETCITVCNEEVRSKIIRELLSATYFDQLLQDPHANYVVQKALRFSQGYLHNCLVHAIESYKAISRNSPYSKRFYSHKLLKR